ncbi:lipopolysaccharide transport periplasmic protein LptA [Citreicella sp. SE45]|uniref:Lipopolysaccharide export system protein LptA n=1 Tax=Salipiger thiooxidans TaxID=282683 RepID=A0A1G7CT81_9RHOB|nr:MULTISPECIES: lipopolysaccharide transport periplasmic protein LptA [Salipiger]EEX13077.1 lipopolysaccharide transport periplasmic protein LptA [Citreicella sp. SE45]MAU47622.1 lipopolysaccharide transport periplasmic protein LptA [Salipiger sp.]MAZ26326.1 lipopolysaccharide transport periplasmic protein LptA [Cytophagaceae bacterium]MBR9837432.1 lipopolysaccharide transport periplasmic protein LptA [Paracoccaceae bacterium]MBN8185194.1 lipopolysaccharide transport periplasmic protein LptA 
MFRFLTAAATLFLLSGPALAQGAQVAFGGMSQDTSAPVEVSADSLQVNQTDGTALYEGNVVIGQGEMRLAAPRVLIVYAEGEGQGRIERMEASGGVTLVSGDEAAEAENADYTIATGVVVMTGNVLLTQGPNALTSERMTVNLEDGTAQMTGRVRTVIQQGTDAPQQVQE